MDVPTDMYWKAKRSWEWEGLKWQCVSLANQRLNTLNTASVCLAMIRCYVWLCSRNNTMICSRAVFASIIPWTSLCGLNCSSFHYSGFIEWELEIKPSSHSDFSEPQRNCPRQEVNKSFSLQFFLFSCQYASLVFRRRMSSLLPL